MIREVAHPHSGSSSTWFLVELEFSKVWFLRRGNTGAAGEKPLGAKERAKNKLDQPTYGVDAGIWTQATLVGGERSHHCAIPCSPDFYLVNKEMLPGNVYTIQSCFTLFYCNWCFTRLSTACGTLNESLVIQWSNSIAITQWKKYTHGTLKKHNKLL